VAVRGATGPCVSADREGRLVGLVEAHIASGGDNVGLPAHPASGISELDLGL
jgi:hypothetical protein